MAETDFEAQRAEAFRDIASNEAGRLAHKFYVDGWGLYQNVVRGKGKPSDMEAAHALFTASCAIYKARGDEYELAKSSQGFSLVLGMLSKGVLSNEAVLRAVEILDRLPKGTGALKKERLTWLMKSLRGLAENSVSTEERMRNARRGVMVLDEILTLGGPTDWADRYYALFNRAMGSTLARKRPRSDADLTMAENLLRQAIALFEKDDARKREKFGNTKAKTLRELARVLRAQAYLAAKQGRQAESAKRLEEAEALLRRSVVLYAEKDDQSPWNHFQLAKVLRDQQKLPAALAECLEAVKVLEEERKKFDEEDNRITLLVDKLAIYDLGIFLADAMDQPEVGFELSERCKARSFVENFHGKHRGRLSETMGTIRGSDRLRKFLAEGEALVEYHVGEYALSIFMLTQEGLKSRRVDCGRERLEKMAARFTRIVQQPTSATQVVTALLKDLSAVLIEPVLDQLSAMRRLRIVPSGVLGDLPFAALPLGTGELAIERWEISYLPSTAMLANFGAKESPSKPRKLLALANPTADLIHAEDEAREVAKIFPTARLAVGDEATKALLSNLDGESHIHLACHGVYSKEEVLGSHLILAATSTDDGILVADSIEDLPLEKVDLAFLSCCRSAHGRPKGGDEFEGVHRAFLHAGARSVVVTLWDIEDAVTQKLVVSFYKHLLEGKPKAQALRQAQLEGLKKDAHPYYWAGFKLVGSAA